MKVFILSFMSCSLLWPIVGWAELYKWTDDQGNFHITDTATTGDQKEVHDVRGADSSIHLTEEDHCSTDLAWATSSRG